MFTKMQEAFMLVMDAAIRDGGETARRALISSRCAEPSTRTVSRDIWLPQPHPAA
jgi:hypothetical protein